MQCAQPLFCFLERFLLTLQLRTVLHSWHFLAIIALIQALKGGGRRVRRWKKGCVSPPPPLPLSLSWPRVTFFYWLTMFRGKWLVYFYFINYCVETTLLNGFSFSLSLLHSPNIHPIRDFFRSKLPLVCYV